MPEESPAKELRPHSTSAVADADQQMERMMGLLLRAGVLAAAATVGVGGVAYLVRHGRETVAYSTFRPRPLSVTHPVRLIGELRHLGPEALVSLGILLLVATPVVRVVLGLVSFARERDLLYVLVSATVLALLVFGTLFGS